VIALGPVGCGGGSDSAVGRSSSGDLHAAARRVDRYVANYGPGDPGLARARRIVLDPKVPADYVAMGVGPGRYPYEATLSDFPRGVRQYLLIRAVDDSPDSNEDANTVVLTATP
jgi:hypothetical protein